MSIGTPTYLSTRKTSPSGPRFANPTFKPPTSRRAANYNSFIPKRKRNKLENYLQPVLAMVLPGIAPVGPPYGGDPVAPPGWTLQATNPQPADVFSAPHGWLRWSHSPDYVRGALSTTPWSTTPISGGSFVPPNVTFVELPLQNPAWGRVAYSVSRPAPDIGANRVALAQRWYFYRGSAAPAAMPAFFPYVEPALVPAYAPAYRPKPYQALANVPLAPPRPQGDFALNFTPVGVTQTTPVGRPPKGVKERKIRMSAAMYGAIAAVNAVGEMIEWVDILAEIGGYPFGRWRNGLHPWMDKVKWLFLEGGIANVSGDDFLLAAAMNWVEDRFYGGLGQMSKSAARNLNLQFGPQTGLAL